MRTRRIWLVLGLLLVPTTVAADDHRADAFGALSYARASNLWGAHGSYARTLNTASKDVSLVLVDFSIHGGSHGDNDNDITQFTFMTGLRYTFIFNGKVHQKSQPFIHVLGGGIHRGNDARDDTDPALALGVGWAYVPKQEGWGVRAQVDYIVHSGEITPRISTGLLWRW